MTWSRLKHRAPHYAFLTVVALIYIFMLAPFLLVVVSSFDANLAPSFPPQELTLRWWKAAFSPTWLEPLWFSLQIALITTVTATILGVVLAFGLTRYKFFGSTAISALAYGPVILPQLVLGVAILQVATTLGLLNWIGFTSLLIGHAIIAMPYAVRTVGVGIATVPPNLERAAMDLGANRLVVLKEIIFPLIRSGIIAGAIFAFVHSFNDVELSLFISSPTEQVINVRILGELEQGFQPVVAAVSVIMFIIPLTVVYLIEKRTGVSRYLYGGKA